MRYNYIPPKKYSVRYGTIYMCDHPVYGRCTLYKMGNYGLAVIQQRYLDRDKMTYWSEIDPWLVDDIYTNPNFPKVFDKYATLPDRDQLYFTITVRQLMWELRMRPLPKQRWETVFDHKDI